MARLRLAAATGWGLRAAAPRRCLLCGCDFISLAVTENMRAYHPGASNDLDFRFTPVQTNTSSELPKSTMTISANEPNLQLQLTHTTHHTGIDIV